jgi:hypothetical protein
MYSRPKPYYNMSDTYFYQDHDEAVAGLLCLEAAVLNTIFGE